MSEDNPELHEDEPRDTPPQQEKRSNARSMRAKRLEGKTVIRSDMTEAELDEIRRRNEAEMGPAIEDEKSYLELQEALQSNDLLGGKVRLSRRGPMDTTFAFVAKMDTNTFDVDQVRKMYGGGDYRAKFFRANGQMGRDVAFSIDHRHKGIIDTSSLPSDGGKGDNGTTTILTKALVESRREDPAQAQMLQAMMKNSSDNMTLMMTMMMKSSEQTMAMMSGMMSAMAQAFGAKNVTPVGNNGLNMQDVMAMFTMLKANDGAKPPTLSELADTLLKMKELSGGGNGAEDEPKTMLDKIVSLAPHVANTVAALKGQTQTAVAAPGATAALPDGTAAPSAQPQDNDLPQVLAMILKAARRKADVSLYRDFLLDSVTDEQVGQLAQLLTNPSWFDLLFGAQTDKEALKPWLTELRNEVLLELTTDDPASGNPVPAGAAHPSGVQPGQDPDRAESNS